MSWNERARPHMETKARLWRLAARRARVSRHRPRAISPVFDFYTIIFLALAIFIFARLRNVLGQRTGRERPPYDPYSARDAAKSAAPRDREKVVPLPGRAAEPLPRPDAELRPFG